MADRCSLKTCCCRDAEERSAEREKVEEVFLLAPGLGSYFRRRRRSPLGCFNFSLQIFLLQRQSSLYRPTHPPQQQWLPRRFSVPSRRTSPSAPMFAKVSRCNLDSSCARTNNISSRRARFRRRPHLRLVQRHLRPRYRSLVRLKTKAVHRIYHIPVLARKRRVRSEGLLHFPQRWFIG